MSTDLVISRFNALKKAFTNGDIGETSFFTENLKEEGLKNLFVIPLFTHYLGFTEYKDYSFEAALIKNATSKSDAIDILIQEKLAIELKNFNSLQLEKKPFGRTESNPQLCQTERRYH